MTTPLTDYLHLLLPVIILGLVALATILVEAFFPEAVLGLRTPLATAVMAFLGFAATAVGVSLRWDTPVTDGAGMLTRDAFTAFLTVVFCLGGMLVVLLSVHFLDHARSGAGEYYCLLLFATAGAYLMAAAHHLIMVFLGLEILSVAIYPLAGFLRRDPRSNEASLKYFLLGAFSSALFLYGMALVYGAVGIAVGHLDQAAQTHMDIGGPLSSGLGLLRFEVIRSFISSSAQLPVFWAGVALLLVGFCFKAGLAPFHMWCPDVYDGSPTPVTAYMSAVVKAAAFAPFFRFFLEVLGRTTGPARPGVPDPYLKWVVIVAAIAILTMTWGNLTALAEPTVKRMLAYSSIAHAGYITVALVSENYVALLYYVLVYTLMAIGSFGCAAVLRLHNGEEARSIHDWAGVGLRYPWLGAAMSLFLFGLAGFPPTAGFMGKLYIFRAALDTGVDTAHQNGYVALVVVALLNSLVSVYYYLRVVVTMYRPAAEGADVHIQADDYASAALAVCAVGVLLLGLFPEPVLALLQNSAL